MMKNNDTSVQHMSNMYIVVTSHLIFVAYETLLIEHIL
jgi:hypothetical protein